MRIFVMIWGLSFIVGILNRMAGSDLLGFTVDGRKLPGHPAIYVAPLIGLLALCFWSPLIAACWVVTYLVWRLRPQGRWICLDHTPDDDNRPGIAMTWDERIITLWSFGNNYIALFWRHLFIWPGLILIAWLGEVDWLAWAGPVVALGFVACHWIARQIDTVNFHAWSEVLQGLTLGLLISLGGLGRVAALVTLMLGVSACSSPDQALWHQISQGSGQVIQIPD